MKSLKYIFFLILVLIIGGSMYIATLDGSYDISESRTMKVPTSLAFNNVNEYKNWKDWGPWFEMDSTIVISYSDNTSGIGASYSWTGAEGNGSMKTLAIDSNSEILQEINFGADSKGTIYWNFEKINDSLKVTWGMKGVNSFGEKAFWLYKGGLEENLNPMFSRGLELLETKLLFEMDKHSIAFKGVVDHGGGYYLYQTISCRIEESGEKMNKILPEIMTYMANNYISASGKPFTLNHQIDLVNRTVMFSVCVPVKERIVTEGDILTGFLEPQKTFKTMFKGSYKFLPALWPEIYKTLNKDGYIEIQKGFSFEVYTVGPIDTENPAEWVTEIYVPIN